MATVSAALLFHASSSTHAVISTHISRLKLIGRWCYVCAECCINNCMYLSWLLTVKVDELKDLGNKAFTAGDFKTSIEHFTEAIALDSKNHVLYSNRSAAFASLKKYKEALSDAEKTVALKPDWAKVSSNYKSPARCFFFDFFSTPRALWKHCNIDRVSAVSEQPCMACRISKKHAMHTKRYFPTLQSINLFPARSSCGASW